MLCLQIRSFDGCLILSEYSLALSCFILSFYLLHYITVTSHWLYQKPPLISKDIVSVSKSKNTRRINHHGHGPSVYFTVGFASFNSIFLLRAKLFKPYKKRSLSNFFFKRTKEMIANLRMEWMENAVVLRECELHKLLRS